MKHELTKIGARRLAALLSDPEWPRSNPGDKFALGGESNFRQAWRDLATQILLTGQPHYAEWVDPGSNNLRITAKRPQHYSSSFPYYPKCRRFDYVLCPPADRHLRITCEPDAGSTIPFRRV